MIPAIPVPAPLSSVVAAGRYPWLLRAPASDAATWDARSPFDTTNAARGGRSHYQVVRSAVMQVQSAGEVPLMSQRCGNAGTVVAPEVTEETDLTALAVVTLVTM